MIKLKTLVMFANGEEKVIIHMASGKRDAITLFHFAKKIRGVHDQMRSVYSKEPFIESWLELDDQTINFDYCRLVLKDVASCQRHLDICKAVL